jgi:hypothetical protein
MNTQLLSVGRIVLAVLGGLGLAVWGLGGAVVATFDESSRGNGAWLSGGLFLLFAASLSTGIMFWRTRHRPTERSLPRVIVSTLAVWGVAVVLFFMLGVGSCFWLLIRGEPLLPKP